MEDKIIEVFKKYSKSVDTEYNVYNCLIEEDWSNIAQELVKLFCQPAVMPRLFFVVARNSEENWEQITQGLDSYEKAKNYRDSDFCKKRWEYAFIVCTINEA